MSDLIERAEHWLSDVPESRLAKTLVVELVAEVKRLRWQVKHGGDHMCDECWPDD